MFDRRYAKVPARPLRQAVTPQVLASWFPDARMVCECPSNNEVCPPSCERFAAKRDVMRAWFAAAEVTSEV